MIANISNFIYITPFNPHNNPMYTITPLSQMRFKSLLLDQDYKTGDRCTLAYLSMFDAKGHAHAVSQGKIRNLEAILEILLSLYTLLPSLIYPITKYFSNWSLLSIPIATASVQPLNISPLNYCNNHLIFHL